MPKPFSNRTGTGAHFHLSIGTKEQKNAFYDKSDKRGLGLSQLGYWFLGGLLQHARALAAICAPTINSYKRYQAGTFAPTKAVWSFDNRTAGFRVLGEGPATRVECRLPGADVNPYLAYAALLAAGIHGIENELELPPAFSGNAYTAKEIPEVPKTLRDAVAALDRSRMLRRAFGNEVVDHYVHAGQWEQAEYDRRITDFELIRYFERG